MSNAEGAKVRAVAAEIVDAVVGGGQSLDAAIKQNETRISASDRSLLRMLCYGVLRHHWMLQEWIDELVAKPLRKRDRVINALLAVGLYQIVDIRINKIQGIPYRRSRESRKDIGEEATFFLPRSDGDQLHIGVHKAMS